MCTQARIAAAARVALATAAALTAAAALAAGRRPGSTTSTPAAPTGQPAPTEGWSAPEHSGEDTTADTCEEADADWLRVER